MPINYNIPTVLHSAMIHAEPQGNLTGASVHEQLLELDTEKLSISNAFMGGYKNKIINGNFDIWQRGTSFTAVSGNVTYTADRWIIYCLGANVSATKESYTTGRSCLNAYGAAGNTALNMAQRIEADVFPLVYGKYYTMSFSVFSSSARNVTVVIKRATTKDNFNNNVDVFSTGFSLSSGWNENKTLTFQSSGNYDTGIQVEFLFGAVTSGNVAIAKVQLEEGSVATPFESRHISQELMMCYRYTRPLQFLTGMASAPTIVLLSGLHQGMRAAPTPTINNVAQVSDMIANYLQSAMNVTVYSNTTEAGIYQLANFTGLTTGRAVLMLSATILLSAEL